MKRHMIGKEISDERLKEIKELNEANRSMENLKTVDIKPTTQTGYNEDGTIKEEKIKPFIYEVNGIKD